jgi:hypothetical protein
MFPMSPPALRKQCSKAQNGTVSWRRGTKGKLSARFAAMRVRVADGPPQRIGHLGQQHLPGEEVWLVGEHRSTGERKYYLSNLPADTPLKKLAGAIKARWVCEQAQRSTAHERLADAHSLSVLKMSGAPKRASASSNATTQNPTSIVFDSRHASTLRVAQSMMTTRYRNPHRIGI